MSYPGEWPTCTELRQILDIPNVEADEWDVTVARVLASAIERVKDDIGAWDDLLDVPDDNMAQAALRMAELMSLRPEGAAATINDPTYWRLLAGRRRRFAIS